MATKKVAKIKSGPVKPPIKKPKILKKISKKKELKVETQEQEKQKQEQEKQRQEAEKERQKREQEEQKKKSGGKPSGESKKREKKEAPKYSAGKDENKNIEESFEKFMQAITEYREKDSEIKEIQMTEEYPDDKELNSLKDERGIVYSRVIALWNEFQKYAIAELQKH